MFQTKICAGLFQPVFRDPETDLANMTTPPKRRNWLRALLLPAVIAVCIGAGLLFHLDRFLSFHALAAHRAWLAGFVSGHLLLALGVFSLAYISPTPVSGSGAWSFTLSSGVLFRAFLRTAGAAMYGTVQIPNASHTCRN